MSKEKDLKSFENGMQQKKMQFAIGVDKTCNVFLDFGIPVKNIMLEPARAAELANIIMMNARKAHALSLASNKKDGKIIQS